jgi:hypothetical protein
MGGRVAYLMAAASKDFKAAITWYGGSCFRQWGDGPTPFERSDRESWTRGLEFLDKHLAQRMIRHGSESWYGETRYRSLTRLELGGIYHDQTKNHFCD